MPYNYINPFGGCCMMAPRMDFFMGMAMLTSWFNPMNWMNSLFNYNSAFGMSSFNNSMFNTYAYNPNSIFTAGGGGYSGNFVYNPSPAFSYGGSIFTPPIQDPVPPSSVGNEVYDEIIPPASNSGVVLNRRGNGYGLPFLNKVKQIAQRINCDYRDLLAVMNAESGVLSHKENPDPNCSATGLIQFTAKTAQQFGTSIPELIRMSPVEQLDYVEKYLVYWKNTSGLTGRLSAGDLYALVFLPGRAGNEVLTKRGEKYYSAGDNENLDVNKDGKITKSELAQRLKSKYVSDSSFG